MSPYTYAGVCLVVHTVYNGPRDNYGVILTNVLLFLISHSHTLADGVKPSSTTRRAQSPTCLSLTSLLWTLVLQIRNSVWKLEQRVSHEMENFWRNLDAFKFSFLFLFPFFFVDLFQLSCHP